MKRKLLFIHGMFLTAKSWERWIPFFVQRGYECSAPPWPFHEAEPARIREDIPLGMGELSLETLIDYYATLATGTGAKPILIGHSMGGLIAQKLIERDLASAAVCISSVAPNAMLACDWSFFRNSMKIANPIKGDDPMEISAAGFAQNFCNTMTRADSDQAYASYAVPESRNVLRDAMGKSGHIDLTRPHAPMLFIAGEKDEIIPDKLNQKNADAYTDQTSVTDFKEFRGRGHFICGQQGWLEVALYAATWLERNQCELEPDGGQDGLKDNPLGPKE